MVAQEQPLASKNTSSKKLEALTGLRFVAALLVCYHHLLPAMRLKPTFELPYGNLAVAFFFVLSGFVLTYAYHNRLKGNVKKFCFARLARIWPLHIICLVMLFLAIPSQFSNIEGWAGWTKLSLHGLLLQSWIPNHKWMLGFNGVAWSISCEMFFYLMFPVLLLIGRKRFWFAYFGLFAATIGASIGLSLVLAPKVTAESGFVHLVPLIQFSPLFTLFDFATGMAAGHLFLSAQAKRATRPAVPSTPARILGFTCVETVALISSFGVYVLLRSSGLSQKIFAFSPGLAIWMVAGCQIFFYAWIICVFSAGKGLWSKLLSSRLLVFLGEISFSLYLCHMTVLKVMRVKFLAGSDHSFYTFGACFLIFSLALSTVLYLLIEIPVRNALLSWYSGKYRAGFQELKKPFANAVTVRLLTTSVLAGGITLVMLHHEKSQLPSANEIVAVTPEESRDVKFANNLKLAGYSVQPCNYGTNFVFVWERASSDPIKDRRMFSLVDLQGKEVMRKADNLLLDNKRWQDDQLVEVIFVHEHKLKPVASIRVGLHSKGVGMTPIVVDDAKTQRRWFQTAYGDLQETVENVAARLPADNQTIRR